MSEEKLDKILYCMQEQLKLYRIVSMSQIERILNENLHDKDEKIIFMNSKDLLAYRYLF